MSRPPADSSTGAGRCTIIVRSTYTRLVHAVYSRLPKGGELPAEEWERRHRAMRQLLWATAVAVVEAFCIVMADELAAATRRPVADAVPG